MKLFLIPFLLMLTAGPALAQWQSAPTPRGSRIELDFLPPTAGAPVLVVAPGQSCNARRPLFEAIAAAAKAQGVGLLRLEWSYCALPEGQRNPSPKLVNENKDLRSALQWLSNRPEAKGHALLIAGKSLGSLVAYEVFAKTPAAKGLALLTPVCSYAQDETGKALPTPLDKLAEHYPGLGRDPRPLLISLGNQDSLCHLPYLYSALVATGPHVQLQTFGGGHSLGLMTKANQEDGPATARNLAAFAQSLMSWAWESGKS